MPPFSALLDLTGAIVPTAASLLVVLSGIVLLASAATPIDPTRLQVIASIFPLAVVEASHLVGSLVASVLILLAPALQRRLITAYWLALGCLFLGVIVSLTKGWEYEQASVLTVIALMLVPYRREFYRDTALLDQPFTPEWLAAVLCILGAALWLMLFAYKHVAYDHTLWFQFTLEGDAARSLRGMFAAATAILIAYLRLLRPPRRRFGRRRGSTRTKQTSRGEARWGGLVADLTITRFHSQRGRAIQHDHDLRKPRIVDYR